MVRLDAGAHSRRKASGVYLVLRGPARRRSATAHAHRASMSRAARPSIFPRSEETELLHFGLPNLAGLRMPAHDELPAQAAE